MDIVTYALCKRLAKSAVTGISKLSVDGTTLKIILNDGSVLNMEFPTPLDGKSITNVTINDDKHLICTLSSGEEIDAGKLPESITDYSQLSNLPSINGVTLTGDLTVAAVKSDEDVPANVDIPITYTDRVFSGDSDLDLADKEDVDEMFDKSEEKEDNNDGYTFADKEDIDNLF